MIFSVCAPSQCTVSKHHALLFINCLIYIFLYIPFCSYLCFFSSILFFYVNISFAFFLPRFFSSSSFAFIWFLMLLIVFFVYMLVAYTYFSYVFRHSIAPYDPPSHYLITLFFYLKKKTANKKKLFVVLMRFTAGSIWFPGFWHVIEPGYSKARGASIWVRQYNIHKAYHVYWRYERYLVSQN